MMRATTGLVLALVLSLPLRAELPLNETAPPLTLSGQAGGRVDGTAWASSELSGKVTVLFYVDPDVKDLNEHVAEALRQKQFPSESFRSVAVINLAASWKPNWLIETMLARKQKQYPRTVYVRDRQRALVRQWQLRDQSSDVVVFDRDGRVLFSHDGRLTAAQTDRLIAIVTEQVQCGNGSNERSAAPRNR